MGLLNLGASASDSLKFFDLKNTAPIGRPDVLAVALAVLFKLFVHVQKQLLNLLARGHVLVVKAR